MKIGARLLIKTRGILHAMCALHSAFNHNSFCSGAVSQVTVNRLFRGAEKVCGRGRKKKKAWQSEDTSRVMELWQDSVNLEADGENKLASLWGQKKRGEKAPTFALGHKPELAGDRVKCLSAHHRWHCWTAQLEEKRRRWRREEELRVRGGEGRQEWEEAEERIDTRSKIRSELFIFFLALSLVAVREWRLRLWR